MSNFEYYYKQNVELLSTWSLSTCQNFDGVNVIFSGLEQNCKEACAQVHIYVCILKFIMQLLFLPLFAHSLGIFIFIKEIHLKYQSSQWSTEF